jgi:NitT/TauT family transport system substrate-binding protein
MSVGIPISTWPAPGFLKKWADKFGVTIKVQRFDHAPSLDAFVAKNIDACTMTNMEALDMPAAAGVDTTAVIVGDDSSGNDAVLVRHNLKLAQIPGKRVLLVEKTVSQYLFERAITLNNQAAELKRVKYVNTSDSDIASAFLSDTSQEAVVSWKPQNVAGNWHSMPGRRLPRLEAGAVLSPSRVHNRLGTAIG